MSGWPLRPDRDSYGPTFQDTAPVRDPARQISAATFNLLCWQQAGMGLLMPRAMLEFVMGVSPSIVQRAEVWNPERSTVGAFADPTFTRTGAGNYLVEYPTPVPDENGDDVELAFSAALAFVTNADPTVLKHAQAAVVSATPKQVRVCAFSSAAAAQDNTVCLLIW